MGFLSKYKPPYDLSLPVNDSVLTSTINTAGYVSNSKKQIFCIIPFTGVYADGTPPELSVSEVVLRQDGKYIGPDAVASDTQVYAEPDSTQLLYAQKLGYIYTVLTYSTNLGVEKNNTVVGIKLKLSYKHS